MAKKSLVKKIPRRSRRIVKRRSTRKMMSKSLVSLIKKVTLKQAETKRTVYVNAAKSSVLHGDLLVLDSAPLKTSQGTADPDVSGTLSNRIGDSVIPVGLSIKFMCYLDPRQGSMLYRWMLVRSPLGDIPTKSTLFVGASDNKLLDQVDKERYTVLASKFFRITRTNAFIGATDYSQTAVTAGLYGNPTGTYYTAGAQDQSPAGKLVNLWIPGYKFGKPLQYQNGSQTPKTYQYTSVILGYTNNFATQSATLTTATTIGSMDDYISKFYFKDF